MPATERDLNAAGIAAARRALGMIRDLQAKLAAAGTSARTPIAVAGLACRYPGADDPAAYWDQLQAGRDAVTEVPKERWDIDAWYDPDPDRPGKMSSRWGGFLKDVDRFDAAHFAITRREAEALDPQHRLLLETSWQALEDAGIAPDSLFGRKVGIFVGLSTNDYGTLLGAGHGAEWIDAYASIGNAPSAAAGRLAYSLGTHGPTLVVDTACSSSLVALHLAIQSLRAGECEIALAAGVNLTLSPELTINFSKAHMLAADGRCKPFAAGADGYVRAEGCGVVVLRRASEALRPRALILGSAVNQDGRSAGLTAPSGPAQEAVLRFALADAGLAPGEVDAIEAHGTGTALGDPIEMHALASVFAGRDRPLWVGSVKSNIGHAEAAAGVAGLIKAILMVEQAAIPPSLHFKELNPHIELDGVDIRVPTTLQRQPLRAVGVSSFGFSGTNAHVLVGPAPEAAAFPLARPVSVLPLAARTETALEALRQAYLDRLDQGADWPALAHTAALRQAKLPWRLAITASDAEAARQALAAAPTAKAGSRPKLGFLVTGQGSAYPGMALGLLPGAPVLRDVLKRCDAVMGLPRPLEEIFQDGAALGQTEYAQPALFALAVGLGEQLKAWGITPDALLGHSVGEYAAVVLAGVLPLEDGARLIARRARLMQALPAGGGMAAVLGARDQALGLLQAHPELEVAAWNAPAALTVAGPLPAIERLAGDPQAERLGLAVHVLPVSHAFHSHLLEPMLQELEQAADLPHGAPQVPVVGNLTGRVHTHWDGRYWRDHARSPVQFEAGLTSLQELGCDLLVELGPQPVLSGFARNLLPSLPTLARGKEPWAVLLETLQQLHLKGLDPDWAQVDRPFHLPTTQAPHYPFERQSYWVPTRPAAAPATTPGMLGAPVEIATGGTVWTSRLAPDRPAFLAQHVVGEAIVVPGASHVAMLLGALGTTPAMLADIAFVAPMTLEGPGRDVQVLRDGETLSLFARGDTVGWTLHVRASAAAGRPAPSADLPAILARCTPDEAGPEPLYAMLDERGIHLGPAFRGIRRLWRGEGEAVAEIALPDGFAADCPELPIHPAALDACFQTLGATFSGGGASGAFLPFAIERVTFQGRCPARFRAHVRARPGSGTLDAAQGDLCLFDEAGQAFAWIDGLSIARLRSPAPVTGDGWSYRIAWERQPLPVAATSPAPAALAEAVRAAITPEAMATPAELGSGVEALAAAYAQAAQAAVPADAVDLKRRRLFAHLPTMAEAAPAGTDPDQLRAQLQHRFGEAPEIAIAARCGRALPAVLRGEQDPLAVLFGDGQAGFLYGGANFAKSLNAMVLAAVEAVIRSSERPARILEIGAGTGALFQALRERVPAQHWTYDFTDISPAFLAQAAERFGADAASFAPLDIEQDPAGQGFVPGSYDVVVAGNVLHATRDLALSLRHAGRLLAPGGTLVILEAARQRAWSDLVFGLTDGWWRFEDTALRPRHPLLSADAWRRLLAEHFADAAVVPSPGEGDQVVAIARTGPVRPVRILRPDASASPLDASAAVLDAAREALAEPNPPALRIVLQRGLAPLEGPPLPAHASVAGLARVLTLEHPELDCRILDSDADLPEAELACGDEPEIAWRGGERYARRLLPAPLPTPIPGDAAFRTSGTHLVTGGLGGLGLGLASWLLDHGAERILLLARGQASAPLPPRVELVRADVTDRLAVQAAINLAGPALRGVFHLAGSLDDGAFIRLDRSRLERVYRAKVEGARLLDELTAGLPLDAFVLFASTAGVLGNPGQANHAGANAFLDALAWQRRARGLPALSIDWGAWAGAGAIARKGVASRFAGEGVGLMDPAVAFDLMGRAIAAGETQLVAAAIDWPAFLRRYDAQRIPAFFERVTPRTRRKPVAPAAAPVPAAGRPTDRLSLGRFIAASAAAVMGSAAGETIPEDQPLNELGLDSLMALELRKALGQGLGLELPATLLFSYPTILALTAHLAGVLGLEDGEPPPPPELVVDEDLVAVQAMSEAEMTALIEREFELTMVDHGR